MITISKNIKINKLKEISKVLQQYYSQNNQNKICWCETMYIYIYIYNIYIYIIYMYVYIYTLFIYFKDYESY